VGVGFVATITPTRDKGPDTSLERRSRHQDTMLAGKARQADVGPQPYDAPVCAAARMRLA
jgi:hypothetical protein